MMATLRNLNQWLACGLIVVLASCAKTSDEPGPSGTTPTASFNLHLEHEWGPLAATQKFNLGSPYVDSLGVNVVLSEVRYFISEVALVKTDGSVQELPAQYLLYTVTSTKNDPEVTLTGVPVGKYSGIRFKVGIDSAAAAGAPQTGDLSPAGTMRVNGMLAHGRFEGTANGSAISYIWLGNAYSQVRTYSFGQVVEIAKDRQPKIHFYVNLRRLFGGPFRIDGSSQATLGSLTDPLQRQFGRNLASGFQFDHVH
jgi:hypothetical protein